MTSARTMAQLRIAWIAPYLPAPENTGGRIRMAQLARHVAPRASIDLYSCGGRQEFARELARHNGALSIYTRCYVRGRRPSMYWLPGSREVPERVQTATPMTLYYQLYREHRRRAYDLAVVCHSYAMGLANALRDCPIVLDEHNVESAYAAETDSAKSPDNLQSNRNSSHTSLTLWEQQSWQRASHITCVSAEDRRVISQHTNHDKVSVIANGADLRAIDFITPSQRASAGNTTVLFVGLMSHAPNEHAAVWMASEVMPRVRAQVGEAKLVLCGRQPSERVQSLASEFVTVTGTVDSVAPYLNQARVVVNPLHHGAGSSLKAIEALASGAPVVSTSIGMRGIAGAKGGHTHQQADDPSAFSQEIIEQWRRSSAQDQSLDTQAERARQVARQYDWPELGRQLNTVIDQVIRSAHTRRDA
jgi:glycosyltransferase involved in cell wall biosynthesis